METQKKASEKGEVMHEDAANVRIGREGCEFDHRLVRCGAGRSCYFMCFKEKETSDEHSRTQSVYFG